MPLEYEIEDIKVTIIEEVKLNPEIKNIIIKSIVSACTHQKLIQHFPHLTFILVDDLAVLKESGIKTLASVNEKELMAGQYIVRIATKLINNELSEKTENEKIQWIASIIIHELTHGIQIMMTSSFGKRTKIIERLEEQVKKITTTDLATVRLLMNNFMQLIHMEGLAQYNEYLFLDKVRFNQSRFAELLSEATRLAMELEDFFFQYIEGKKQKGMTHTTPFSILTNKMTSNAYNIGLHMVYSILYLDDTMTFEKLLQTNYLGFIKKYEECMQKKGYKPIVTVANTKGILVYQKMLKEWSDLLQKDVPVSV